MKKAWLAPPIVNHGGAAEKYDSWSNRVLTVKMNLCISGYSYFIQSKLLISNNDQFRTCQ